MLPLEIATILPGPSLQGHVSMLCRLHGPAALMAGRCLPKAHGEVIIRIGGEFLETRPDGMVREVPEVGWLSGPRLSPLDVAGAGIATLYVARLRTGAVPLIWRGAARESIDQVLGPDSLDCGSMIRLRDWLSQCQDALESLRLFASWLEDRLGTTRRLLDARSVSRLDLVATTACSTSELRDRLDRQRRDLARLFHAHVGVAPRQWLGMWRFNRAIGRLAAGGSIRDLIGQAGYYDQPQLTRDFRRRGGLTPGDYLQLVRRGAVRLPAHHLVPGGRPAWPRGS